MKKVRAIRKPALQACGKRPELDRFEQLVDDLSAAIAHASAEAVDHEIESWLARICVALDVDRGAIHECDTPGKKFRVSLMWLQPGTPAFPKVDNPIWNMDDADDWVLAGNRLVFSRASEISAQFPDLKRFVSRYGPKASAIFPMWAGNRVIGCASFGRFRSHRNWDERLLRQLEVAVRIFGSAIERKQAETVARAARAELALTQRRSMMGELIASLTHELNQPLGAIMSNLEGLARLLSGKEPNVELARNVLNNSIEDTRRASEIIRRVRAMFRGRETRKTPLDISVLACGVVRLMAREASLRRISVQVETSHSTPNVFGDEVLLQQCILNLMMNAFESVSDSNSEERTVKVGITREGAKWVAVSVTDNGSGIHQSVRERLFDPFVTTKTGGMGLGLLVTRSIVEEHGGRIGCHPNAGGGAVFTFTLPAVQPKFSRSRRSARQSARDLSGNADLVQS